MTAGLAHVFFFLLMFLASVLGHATDDLSMLVGRFPEQKVMQERNLPIRVAQENWGQAIQRVATDSSWQAWQRSTQAALDAWMSKPRDRANWVGGYQHNLFDPATKLPMKWSTTMPEPRVTTDADRKLHEAWVAWTRSNNFDKILEAARIYRLTGEKRYADWAVSQIDLYADNYAIWPLQQLYGSRSRMMGQGLDEATATVRLIDAVRLLHDYVSFSKLNGWRDKLFYPIVDNLRNSKVGMNNISLWHAAATAEIALQFGDDKLFLEAIDGPMGIRAILKLGVTEDFIWYEGSLGYQTYVLRALAPLFVHASLMGRANDLAREMLIAQNMLLAPLAIRFEDGMLPNPGDATSRLKAIDLAFMLELYRTLPTRIGLIEASRKKNWDTLLDPVAVDLTVPAQLPVVKTSSLESIRMAVLKADGWQVFLRYGQLTIHHAQADALNTEIYFQNIPISTNPATVLYESSLHKDYFHRAISHNVPLVDGEGQVGWDAGKLDNFDAQRSSVAVRQPRLRPDASATRAISIQDGQLLDRLTLSLNPGAPTDKRLGFLFHTDCDLELMKGQLGPEFASPPPHGTGFAFWEQIMVRDAPTKMQARLHCGTNEFVTEFKVSAASRLYTARAPSTPLPKKRAVIYFELMGRDAAIEMRLQHEAKR